jgi:glucose-1-phosphate adenylyltransferase
MAILSKNQKKTSLTHFQTEPYSVDMSRIATVILGGGQGSRLYPLTQTRCKPVLRIGGRFHLIDVPISNSINSGCNKIYIITQFLSSSLHQHIFKTYRHNFHFNGFIEMLPAEEKPTEKEWFQGTADAVRKNLNYLYETPVDYFLILSGDQLYHMNFQHMLRFAKKTDADVVIATIQSTKEMAKRMGILNIDSNHFISDFNEKPQDEMLLKKLLNSQKKFKNHPIIFDQERPYLGSMGIYLFKRKALFKLLEEDLRADFGKHLIPSIVKQGNAAAFPFDGYWEDIGTIESFYKANIALTESVPQFDCYNNAYPIFSSLSNLPSPKIYSAQIDHSIICEGSIVEGKQITNSILGPRTIIKKETIIESSYLMGNNFYKSPIPAETFPEDFHIGEGCIIKNAIIDKHVHVGNGVKLINKNNLQHYDGKNIFIRDGIIVVPKGAYLPNGFIL